MKALYVANSRLRDPKGDAISHGMATLSLLKDLPENCEIGDVISPDAVPHWDARIRLTEFYPTLLKPGEKPWLFAASYLGMDVTGWKRIE